MREDSTHKYAPETVDRVLQAARDLNYVPNLIASSLARRRTHLLALAWDRAVDLRKQSYFLELFAGIHEVTRKRSFNVAILTSHEPDGADLLRQLQSGLFDGMILMAPAGTSPVLDWVQSTGYPVVSAGSSLPTERRLSCVDVDNVGAAEDAVNYLIARGHRRIGYIGGYPTHLAAAYRRSGYERAMTAAGLDPLPWHWQEGDLLSRNKGRETVRRLVAAHPKTTAVFCANDETALGAIEALEADGVDVPGDVSIVGFDDIEAAQWVRPALTTVRQETAEIGRRAAELLMDEIDGEKSEPHHYLLPGRLIERASVADRIG